MKVPAPVQQPSGRWFVRVRLDGVAYSKTFDTEKEAAVWATSIKAQHMAGDLKKRQPDEEKTIRQLILEYIDQNALAPNTLQCYRTTMRHHFGTIMDVPYCKIRNWQKAISLDLARYNPNTVRRDWSDVKAALRFFGLDVPDVKIPKKQRQKKNYLTADQIPVFCDAIRGHRFEVLFLMMLSSMRVSEALGVTRDDIKPGGIHVRGTKTPAADRFIPWMIPRLKELCLSGDPLPETDRRVLNYAIKPICEEAGLPELSCHSLRVSFASLCYSKGVPERVCMRIGGWASLQVMHDVYIRISDDDVARYTDVLADSFH